MKPEEMPTNRASVRHFLTLAGGSDSSRLASAQGRCSRQANNPAWTGVTVSSVRKCPSLDSGLPQFCPILEANSLREILFENGREQGDYYKGQ